MHGKRVLEINPAHPIIKELLERVNDGADEDTKDLATILYESSLLNSGYSLSDPTTFTKRFFKIFNGAMGIAKDAPIEEPEIDLEEDDDDDKPHHDDDHDHAGHNHHHDEDEDENKENFKVHYDDLWETW